MSAKKNSQIEAMENCLCQTPEKLANDLCREGPGIYGLSVLEPSGGNGRIVKAMLRGTVGRVTTIENNPQCLDVLRGKFEGNEKVSIYSGDFLEKTLEDLGGKAFDAAIMHPPFENGEDIDHVLHAAEMIRPGGFITAIMGAGMATTMQTKYQRFRNFIMSNSGSITVIPFETFKAEKNCGSKIRVYIPIK